MKQENKLQHDIVMWFSHNYPQLRGSLWAVFNEDSKHKKALGLFDGASDLMLFVNGIYAGIELKAPMSYHKPAHIKRQIEWGKHIIDQGGLYLMSSSESVVKSFIEHIATGTGFDHAEMIQNAFLFDIELSLKNGNKTIKF